MPKEIKEQSTKPSWQILVICVVILQCILIYFLTINNVASELSKNDVLENIGIAPWSTLLITSLIYLPGVCLVGYLVKKNSNVIDVLFKDVKLSKTRTILFLILLYAISLVAYMAAILLHWQS